MDQITDISISDDRHWDSHWDSHWDLHWDSHWDSHWPSEYWIGSMYFNKQKVCKTNKTGRYKTEQALVPINSAAANGTIELRLH